MDDGPVMRARRWIRTRATIALTASMVVVALSTEARAQDDTGDPPSGRFGVKAGVRGGTGRFDFGLGFTGAVVAGYSPIRLESRIAWGVEWAVAWTFYELDENASITGSLRLLEFDLGGRMRIKPNPHHLNFIVLGAGALLMRANAPIPPDAERSYIGPYVSLGFEPKVGDVSLGFDARYSMLVGGPPSLMLSMTVSAGK